jgi:autotransporter translocation and assembly factor TamB
VSRKGKRRWRKRRWVLIGGALLLIVASISVAVLRSRFNGPELARRIEHMLNDRIRGRVVIGSIEWPLAQVHRALGGGWVEATVTGLEVYDEEAGELVLEVPRATLAIDARTLLFGGDFIIDRVTIEPGAYARIKEVPEPYPLHEYDRYVVSLIAAFYPKQSEGGFRAGLTVYSSPIYDLRTIELSGAELDFEFPDFTANVQGAGGAGFFFADVSDPLKEKMYYSLGPLRAPRGTFRVEDMEVELRDVSVSRLDQLPLEWPRSTLAESVRWEGGAVTAEGAVVHTRGAMLEYWTDFFGGDYLIDLTVTGAGPLTDRLSEGLAGGDDLDVAVRVSGPVAAPKVRVQLTGLDLAIPVREDQPPLDLELARTTAVFDLATNSGYLEDTVARGGGGLAQVSAKLSLDPFRFDLNASIDEEIELAPYLPPDVAALAGTRLRGRLHAFGTGETQQLDRLELWLGRAYLQGQLVRDERQVIHANDLDIYLGATEIHARGVIDVVAETFDLLVRYSSRDLPRYLRYFRLPALATGVTGTARVGGSFDEPRASAELTATGVPIIDRVAASVGYAGEVVHLRRATSAAMDGSIRASGRFQVGPVTRVLGFEAEADGLDLSRAPVVGGLLAGRLDATARASGPIDRLQGTAEAEVRELSVAGDPFARATLSARADVDGSQEVKLHLLRRDGGLLDANAIIGRNGELGGVVTIRDIELDRIAALGDQFVGGAIETELHLGGTVEAPTAEGDITLAGAWLGKAFLGPGDLHLEPAGDGLVAITGSLFQGRVQVDATVQTRAPYAVEARLGLVRVELDQFLPELAAEYQARGWVSGTVDLETTLQPVPGRRPKAEIHLTEASLLVDNQDASGRPAPLRLRNRSPLHLSFDGDSVAVAGRAVFAGPGGDFTLTGSGGREQLDFQLRGDVSVAMLQPYLRDHFEQVSGMLQVQIEVAGPVGEPRVEAVIDIADVAVKPARQDATVSIPGGRVVINNQQLSFTGVTVYMHDPDSDQRAALEVSGGLALEDFAPKAWSLQIDGELAGKMLLVAAPLTFSQASGTAELTVAILGAGDSPKIDGSIAFDTARPLTVTPRGLRRELAFTGGEIKFTDQLVEFVRLQGNVDDEGRIRDVSGEVSLQSWEPVDIDLTLTADSLPFRVPKTLDMNLAVENLRLVGSARDLYIGGTIEVIDGRYIQNFNLAGLVFRPEETGGGGGTAFYEEVPWLANAQIDLRVETRSFFVQNNLAPSIEMAGMVRVTGTPARPRIDGEVQVEQGTFRLPTARAAFTRTQGSVSFSRFKRFPEETPVLDIRSEADYRDSSGQDHLITFLLQGPISNPDWDLYTSTGLNKGQTFQLLFSGKTPEELRATLGDESIARDPTKTERTATQDNVYDQIVKDVAGDFLSLLFEDRLRNWTSLDVARIEIGTGSFALRGEKNIIKNVRAKGEYEWGVRGQTIDARGELRLDEQRSAEIKYLNQDFNDESEEDRQDLRIQLIWRFPLLY